jgi:aldehyde dehydrogenase (NAD+)
MRVADQLELRFDELVQSWVVETGAPRWISEAFHRPGIASWRQAARLHERVVPEPPTTLNNLTVRVFQEPVGVVAAITPWNGPVATTGWKVAPALAAGCAVILKTAPEASLSGMVLCEALAEAGLPDGVVSVLPGGIYIGERLARHCDVDTVSFAGTVETGQHIIKLCADRMARVTVELPSRSAAIIVDLIPLDGVLPQVVREGIAHCGQVWGALTKILVPRKRQAEVVGEVKEMLEALTLGDPAADDAFVGPLAGEGQRVQVERCIKTGWEEGATVVTGGERPADLDRGWYMEPTLFADVEPHIQIARECIFGPVLTIIPFDTVEEAIWIANETRCGPSGVVIGDDSDAVKSVARRVRARHVAVNSAEVVTLPLVGNGVHAGFDDGAGPFDPYVETKVIHGLGV